MYLDPNKCWEWGRAKAGNGYGVLSFLKRNYYTHRVAYRLFIGEIPNGIFVCHKCDNPGCFNPNHLFLGTAQDNVSDMIRKGRSRSVGSPGSKNGNHKFTDDTVLKIRKDFSGGLLPRDLKQAYGISSSQLWRITHYKTRPKLKP